MGIMVSIIIPTFNEMALGYFKKSIEQLSKIKNIEVIVVDTNSTDGTRELVQEFNFKLITLNTTSRAARLNEGIRQAKSELILLHHPRSLLDIEGVNYLIENQETLSWGGFIHSFDKSHGLLRFTSWYSNHVRLKMRGIVYLDHCIYFKRKFLDKKTPIPEVEIFEDTLLSDLLRKNSWPELLPFKSTTSAVRFSKNGVWFQAILNQVLKICYYLNFSDKSMNKVYEKGLALNSLYKRNEDPKSN